jgi:hypothetical protein
VRTSGANGIRTADENLSDRMSSRGGAPPPPLSPPRPRGQTKQGLVPTLMVYPFVPVTGTRWHTAPRGCFGRNKGTFMGSSRGPRQGLSIGSRNYLGAPLLCAPCVVPPMGPKTSPQGRVFHTHTKRPRASANGPVPLTNIICFRSMPLRPPGVVAAVKRHNIQHPCFMITTVLTSVFQSWWRAPRRPPTRIQRGSSPPVTQHHMAPQRSTLYPSCMWNKHNNKQVSFCCINV